MKKIIKGRKYDTETATNILYYESHLSSTDFGWYEETLYQKKNGEFFLAGRGNAASKYAEAVDANSYGPGKNILPLSLEEAKEWASHEVDLYEKIFGEVAE